MAYSTLPISGVDLNDIQSVVELAANGTTVPTFGPLGAETFASDGKRYVWAKAAATLTPSTTTCTVNASTFLVTGSAGAYVSPAVSMVSGDYGWFGTASV
jgi:hypothetical protein